MSKKSCDCQIAASRKELYHRLVREGVLETLEKRQLDHEETVILKCKKCEQKWEYFFLDEGTRPPIIEWKQSYKVDSANPMENILSNEALKIIIGGLFLFIGVIFFYFLGWNYLMEGRTGGWVGIIIGLYFITALFWMYRSMKHLYIAAAIPIVILITAYILVVFI